MRKLTKLQQRVLEAISLLSDSGKPPTHAELAKEAKIKSRSHVGQILKSLESKYYIELISGKRRNIRLIRDYIPVEFA